MQGVFYRFFICMCGYLFLMAFTNINFTLFRMLVFYFRPTEIYSKQWDWLIDESKNYYFVMGKTLHELSHSLLTVTLRNENYVYVPFLDETTEAHTHKKDEVTCPMTHSCMFLG